MTAQLVDASRNTHVWSNTYNRDLGDLFAVQDDIASKVAVALQSTLEKLGVNGAEPDPQAYPHFLAGRFNRRTPGDLERAVRNLEQAVALDPEYADVWVMLSGAYRALAWDAARPAEWRQRQRDAALRAIAVDPALWSAQVRLATYYFEVGDRVRALEHFRHASKLKPDDPWLARFENGFPPCSADLDMFVAMHRKAAETDPLSATARRNLGVMLFASGQLDEALTEFQRSQDLAADSATSLEVGRVLLAQRRDDDAYREFMQLPSGEYRDYGLALMQGVPAHRAEADAALRRLARLPGDPMHGLRVAEAYVLRAQPDRSFEWLQRTRDGLPRDESLFARVCDLQLEMSLSPFLKPLQADARWAALMANGA